MILIHENVTTEYVAGRAVSFEDTHGRRRKDYVHVTVHVKQGARMGAKHPTQLLSSTQYYRKGSSVVLKRPVLCQ